MKTNQKMGNIFNVPFQQNVITGKVVDYTTNSPMDRVNVYLKENHSIGTSTNEQGQYALNLQSAGTIIFSHIGFETEYHPSNNVPSTIFMIPKTEGLDEVVVTATTPKPKPNTKTPWKYVGYLGLLLLAILIGKKVAEDGNGVEKK